MKAYLPSWLVVISKKNISFNCTARNILLILQVLLGQKEATARIRGGLRRDGPNDFMFVNDLIQKDLTISILFVLSFCFVSHVFYFLQLDYNSQSCNLHLLNETVYYS